MTYFSVDVETSGLNPIVNDVTSISVIERDTLDHCTCAISGPHEWDEDTRKWAEANIPASVSDLIEVDAGTACQVINEFIGRFPKPWTFIAWPASFDYPFVQKLYSKTDQPFPFHYRTVDLHSLIVGRFGGDISKGRSDSDLPGIIVEPTPECIHNPYYDALAQLETFNNVMAGLTV